ncbi:hypothetical protein TruAng_012202 [Truncatella angustata]|nr:hypothetical protein TruAng_012202 [Truncatella angustata]
MYHNAIDNRMEMEVQRAIRDKSRKAQAHARALATPQPTSQICSRTADRETSEERAQAVPLSIYDIIPDDDGDTVIVHDPSSAAGRQAHPGPSSDSGKHSHNLIGVERWSNQLTMAQQTLQEARAADTNVIHTEENRARRLETGQMMIYCVTKSDRIALQHGKA